MLISEAFELYRRNVISFRNQSSATERHHFDARNSLIKFFGDMPVEQLDFDAVRSWKQSMEDRHLSAETIRGYLIRLRVVLAHLKARGEAVLDLSSIPLPKRTQRLPGVLTAEEVQNLIDSTQKLRNKAMISLMYSTGLRVSELCSLERKDVLGDHFTIRGKGGRSRICYIDERTRGLLDQYLKQRSEGYSVMVKNHGKWTDKPRYRVKGDSVPALFIQTQSFERIKPSGVQEVIKRARLKAGIDWPVHPHTVRHSFATNLALNGIDLYQLMKLMGHSSLETTKLYIHIHDKHLQEDYLKYHSV